MENHPHNRLRQLQGLVTIDAWHEKRPSSLKVELHAYVHFDEARLGGQARDEVAFRLHLKRAELKLLQSEPKSYAIDPANIWRGDQDPSGQVTHKLERGRSQSIDCGLDVALRAAPELNLRGGGRETRATNETFETVLERSTKTIVVSFGRNDRDQPTWVFQPSTNAPRLDDMLYLKGQPWDDKLQRLLLMNANKNDEKNQMLSSLRLCLLCRREDLHFHDICIRNEGQEFVPINPHSPKRVIVQEYLRQALLSEGLPGPDMNSPFSIIHLGEALSEQRRPDFDEE